MTMQRILNYTLLLMIVLGLSSCEQKPQKLVFFEGSLGQLKEEAKSTGKPYYVYFSADWCQPCTVLKKNVFSVPEVYEYSNEHFLALQVDVDEFNGQELSRTYQIDGIPAILFFDSEGNYIDRVVGLMNSEQFLQILQEMSNV